MYIDICIYIYIYVYVHICTFSLVALSRMRPFGPNNVCCATQQNVSTASLCRHVCSITQQTCLLCDTADMSVSHNTPVCCLTQLTCLLPRTAEKSAAAYSRHVC